MMRLSLTFDTTNVFCCDQLEIVRVKRFVVLLLLAVFLAPSFGHTHAFAAQLGPELPGQDEFDEIVDDFIQDEPLYGPRSTDLAHDPSTIAFYRTYAQTADFLLAATFGNPYDGDDHKFDFGVRVRTHRDYLDPTFLQFNIDSEGVWWLEDGLQSDFRDADAHLLDSGSIKEVDSSAHGSNDLTVYLVGDVIAVAVNGDLISSVEVPFDDLGDILIGTGFYDETWQKGAVTEVEDITVWSLE
jgi:hypothetical protein